MAKRSEEYGIVTGELNVDFGKVQQRKNKIVEQLYKGVQHLMAKGKIDVFEGTGRILGPSIFSPMPGTISVEMTNGEENEILIPENVVIATGSRPKPLSGLEFDGIHILSSDDALNLESIPESLLIVGGGVIGIEWASMMADFGSEVTVIEYADRILPGEDGDISREMERLLKKKGVRIIKSAKVLPKTVKKGSAVEVSAEIKGDLKSFSAEKLLISVGRQANLEGIGLENTDIVVEKGFISTNEFFQTKETHIYAIGDCIGGLQLAHVASHEGIAAVEHIAEGKSDGIDYLKIPKCVYSSPETASVGLTEEEARKKGFSVKTGKFSFKGIGKALVYGESDGFVKIVADQETDDVLGVHMIGPHVTDMISEAGLAMVLDATPWEISKAVHPHPSLSEVIGEAALAVDGKAIHS